MKRIQLWLSLVGCLCSLAGALLLSAASFPALIHDLNQVEFHTDGAVYVNGDMCFSCHGTGTGWGEGVHPRLIDTPIVNPHAAARSSSSVDSTRLIINNRTASLSAQPVSSTPRQQYVVETDSGTRVLAGHWLLGDELVYLPDPESDETEACIDCHVTPSAPKRGSRDALGSSNPIETMWGTASGGGGIEEEHVR
ncbi:MAG: hypothetical protein U0670_18215 [Anaerolineae bacterium]